LFFLLGTSYLQLKKYNKAIDYLNIAINLNSKFADSYNNRGIALAENEKYSEAVHDYDKAINLKINYVDAYLNKGIALKNLGKLDDAKEVTELAIRLQPSNAKAYNNLGNIFQNQKKLKESVKAYDKAIKINPEYFEAISNIADALHNLKLYDKALIYNYKIFDKYPNFEGILIKILSNKMHIYDWNNLRKITEEIKKKVKEKKIIIDALFINYLTDNPDLIKLHSEEWVKKTVINIKPKLKNINISKPPTDLKLLKKTENKIKIGYFSADFKHHVVLHIMANIFKHHDNSKFELYAFSHGEKKEDEWRKIIKSYFKKFYTINDMTDDQVINLTRNEEIDIAVNLTGLTRNHRTGIFLKRVAPIQINYLGYPGTMGIKSMDYIIADKIIIPDHEKKYYSEKVKYLPECYISEAKDLLLKSTKNFTRLDFNLPDNKFIFCAIHNPLKINPRIFGIWVKILKRVKNSVLWITANNEPSKENILSELKKNGLEANRIVFAGRVKEGGDHLKRLKLADLLLDTYPYNSHSTTYDYINAGLPMVTLKGNSFASRVGASIYSSLKLQELIAKTESEYENIAVKLANDELKIKEIKDKMKKNAANSNLFKAKEFTKELEQVYLEIFNENI
jgi:predicted O-linked N-acetylglucosamine transferase (SPINDLY family)